MTGTVFFTLFEGDADAKLMSHFCLDAFEPEFDNGWRRWTCQVPRCFEGYTC